MNVKQLKEALKDLDDNLPILTSGDDHSYIEVSGYKKFATYRRDAHWYNEYFNDNYLDGGEEKIEAFIII